MSFLLRLALLCCLIPLTEGCAQNTLVALVPDPSGTAGHISVTSQAGSVDLSDPYQVTAVKDASKAPAAPKDVDKEKLLQRFDDALAVQPSLPRHFLFYFTEESKPTPASLDMLPRILASISERNSRFISVIGHADTTGPEAYNVDVTLRRALLVRDLLVERGVAVITIYPSWEGEKNLAVPTADEVRELRNRMVEVIVR